jgi:hypothetical protein
MTAAIELAAAISEPMTWAEICARYPDQRVCLVEIDRAQPHGFAFRTARVVGSGKTSREALDRARPWRDRYAKIGHYFTGRISPPVPHLPRLVMTVEIRELLRNRR